jgi:hypothetical protein
MASDHLTADPRCVPGREECPEMADHLEHCGAGLSCGEFLHEPRDPDHIGIAP